MLSLYLFITRPYKPKQQRRTGESWLVHLQYRLAELCFW